MTFPGSQVALSLREDTCTCVITCMWWQIQTSLRVAAAVQHSVASINARLLADLMMIWLWDVYTRHGSRLWVLNICLCVDLLTHIPQFSTELATTHRSLTQVSRWQCETSSRLTLLLPQAVRLPCVSDPAPLADMSTALLHTQPISIELSLTHFAHSLMKQGNRWSAFNEIRVGPAPLNHLSRLKARGLLACQWIGYTKPQLQPRSGYQVWFPSFL